MNVSQSFFEEIDKIARREIPADVMARARRSLLDYLAVTCAGTAFQKEKLERYFAFACPEVGSFKAIGTNKSMALKEAVFLNGLNAHALDFDDGTNSGIIHLGSPIFSLLIPLSQRYDIGVSEMLKAAIIGYEASYTLTVNKASISPTLTYTPNSVAVGENTSAPTGRATRNLNNNLVEPRVDKTLGFFYIMEYE